MENIVNKGIIYNNAKDFFLLDGSIIMKLTASAAEDVCKLALSRNKIIIRIEGGIWHNPGFEARADCIWDGIAPTLNLEEIAENNKKAFQFIEEEKEEHDVFLITTKNLS